MTKQLGALSRLQETAAEPKQLGPGVYLSKTAPQFVRYYDYEDDQPKRQKTPPPAAILGSNDINDNSTLYLFQEVPQRLLKVNSLGKLMVNMPAIMTKAKGATYVSKLSNGYAAFCYKCSAGYLIITLDND